MKLHLTDPKTVDLTRYWGTQNALLTAGDKTGCNTMTIGWGQNGLVWGLPVCTVYVRPERYTYEFMEENEYFTLSFLGKENRSIYNLCGSKSGREVDKVKETGLNPIVTERGNILFEQDRLGLECRKLFITDMKEELFLDHSVYERWYGGDHGGLHRVYVAEIVDAWVKE